MALLLFPGIAAADPDSINLAVGEAKTISIKDFTKVANSNPEVVEVIITGGQDILLNAKKAGFSLVDVWKNKDRVSYKIIVQEDYSAIETDIGKLINNPAVSVKVNEKYVTLSGTVDNSLEADQAVQYGKIYRENIINNLIVKTHYQILLSILVTEIKKDSEKKYGLSWGNWWPTTDGLVFHDWENNFQGNNQGGLGLVSGVSIGSILNLMQSNGDAKILAAPSILTVSGKEALFLAGGEIPIPMPDGKGGTVVSWKEYGVKLNVTANFEKDNLISMAVSPEVSSIDWSNAIVVNGFKLPAFSTRKATTNVQFKDGSTLIIGGLLKREDAVNVYKFPILGDLPIIGALFRNKHFQKGDTELLFFVTPRIIRDDMKLDPGTIVNPTPGPYFQDDQKK
jgi:pilus assembly protein CpaC